MVVPSAVLPGTEWFQRPQKFGFHMGDRDQYLRQYAEMDFSLHRPRQLMGELDYSHGGLHFRDYLSQCDQLIGRLQQTQVPLNITDDWMLMGKLSGLPMDDFRNRCVRSIATGDYTDLAQIISAVNRNTKKGYWPSSIPARAVDETKGRHGPLQVKRAS